MAAELSDEITDYINMGMFTGMYLLVEMIKGGWNPTERGLDTMLKIFGDNIEKISGMPAEDYALLMRPGVDEMLKHIEELSV